MSIYSGLMVVNGIINPAFHNHHNHRQVFPLLPIFGQVSELITLIQESTSICDCFLQIHSFPIHLIPDDMVQLSRVIGSLAAFSFATALPLECQGPPPTQENDAVQSSSSSSSTGSNANAVGNQSGGKQPKALYLTTNQAPNNIISLGINVNGTLRMGNIVPTGGNGASGINGMNDMPAGPDAMFDQSPLAVSGNVRFPDNPTLRGIG